MHVGLNVKYLLLSGFNHIWNDVTNFSKISILFHEDLFSDS